jgi:hypothetical protein
VEERRGAFRRHAALAAASRAAAALGAALALAAGAAPACELPGARVLEGARLTLAYRTVPARLAAGEHFAVEIALCPKGGNLPDREDFPVLASASAHMPEHRHGMNYKPGVRALGQGRFRTEGWMFHMPGRWEFVFEAGGERFTDSVRLE